MKHAVGLLNRQGEIGPMECELMVAVVAEAVRVADGDCLVAAEAVDVHLVISHIWPPVRRLRLRMQARRWVAHLHSGNLAEVCHSVGTSCPSGW